MKFWKLYNYYNEIIRVVAQENCPPGYVKATKAEYIKFKETNSEDEVIYPGIV